MKQLTGLDASYVYLERPSMPTHIAGLSIYDQSTNPRGKVRFKEIIGHTIEKIDKLSTLRQKLCKVPFDLDHPYWVPDENFNPEYHIRHIALPKPGDWRQLCILVARLHSRPLDLERPLWEMYVIEGLDNVNDFPGGSFAIFTKIHHAAADGSAAKEILQAIHELSPDGSESFPEPVEVELKPAPGPRELLVRAAINNLRSPFRLISVARNTIPDFARAYSKIRQGDLKAVSEAPGTRFNAPVSAYRVFCGVQTNLGVFKDIRNSVPGTTVNDVAISICGGALRKYLASKDELPESSLMAMIPINVRDESERNPDGNIVSMMVAETRTDIADPLARLEAVAAGTRNSKELSNAIGARVMTDYSTSAPSVLMAQSTKLASRLGLMHHSRPTFNCCISNVPGPQVPLYASGAKLLANFGLGQIVDGLGLFHMINSYNGQLSITATSCREIMPDPGFYEDCLRESLDEHARASLKKIPARRGKSRARKAGRRSSAA